MSARTGKNAKAGARKETKDSDEEDIDALFQLPFSEFTTARNALALRLKKAGRGDTAATVKAFVRPPISAWAVNQLYWKHREAFNNLVAAGRRFRQAQESQFAGKAADTRGAQSARREALSILSRLADALLRDGGHNPTPDTMRRVTASLEAVSTYSPVSDTPPPGRLTKDLNPPGFESVAGLIPAAVPAKPPAESTRVIPFRPSLKQSARNQEERDHVSVAAAKAPLLDAEQALREARNKAEDLALARKEAAAHLDEAERKRLEAEERHQKARLAEQEARKRLHSVAAEAERAAKIADNAARAVEKALEALKGK